MIIQIRGTSGSGKSTVMRTVMERLSQLGDWSPHFVGGRKKPLWYFNIETLTVVLGHYESPCGGCDNVGSAPDVFSVVEQVYSHYQGKLPPGIAEPDILCEGLILCEDVNWTLKLTKPPYSKDVRCLFLTTEINECLRRVRLRRSEAGNDKPLSLKKTVSRFLAINRVRDRLYAHGICCPRCSSKQAPDLIDSMLRLHAQRED